MSELGFVRLLPFIQFGESPSAVNNTCYFYSKSETRGERMQALMIAYQFADEYEKSVENEELLFTLQELRDLTKIDDHNIF
jgi:hypothetical protein